MTPFSRIPTRFTSRPRMIGRLEAPGAKVEPVMPGLENRRSPSWAVPWRRISSFGTTVTVANWSVTTGSTPCCGAGATGAGGACGARSRFALGDARTTRVGAGERTIGRRTIGLGAVTVTSGSCVEEDGAGAFCATAPLPIAHSASQLAPPIWNARLLWNLIVWGPDAIDVTGRFRLSRNIAPPDAGDFRAHQSTSGDGWRARLERRMDRVQTD